MRPVGELTDAIRSDRYLGERLAIEPYQPVLSLRRRLRCTRCHARVRVDIKIEWRG